MENTCTLWKCKGRGGLYVLTEPLFPSGNKEVQEIDCDATSGTIDLNFNGALVNVDYDATASELEDALETLAT